jgi:hypothetical protein
VAHASEATATPERDENDSAHRVLRRWSVGWTDYLAALTIAGLVAFSLAATKISGGAVPQNDDWSYVKGALALHRTGEIRLQGWGQMFLLGQTYTAQPLLWVFGDKTSSLNLYGACMTVLWLWCAYLLGKRCVGAGRAVLLVVALALWPGMGLLVSSFMTDVPAAATSLLAMVLGLRAIDRQSRLWLGLAIVAGVWSFTIREQFVLGLPAVLVAALLGRNVSRRFKIEITTAIGLAGVLCLVLEQLRRQLPHADVAPFGLGTLDFSSVPQSLLRVPFTLGFEFAPIAVWVLLTLRGRDWIDPGRIVGWALGLATLGGVAYRDAGSIPHTLLSNYLTRHGAFSVSDVGRPPAIFSTGVWHAAEIVAGCCGVIVLGELGAWLARLPRHWRAARGGGAAPTIVAGYTAAMGVVTVGLSFAGQLQVDRYLLPVLPGLGILLLTRVRAERLARPVVRIATLAPVLAAALFLAALSARVTLTTDRRDHAVWAAASRLVRLGVPATSINAGLDWNGTHSPAPLQRDHAGMHHYIGQDWTYTFPGLNDCYIVAVSPVPRIWLRLIEEHDSGYHTWTYYNTRCGRSPG